jgi:hypothetical protein
MTPTDLQLVQGDATTIPEETAFAAYQTLREARTNPKLAANPALATSREALKSYVTERRRHGHDLFPSVTTAANRERNDSLAGLYTKPLEKALPQQAFADLTRKMEFVPDPETFKMREINRTFLSATVGQAIPPEKYDTIRTIYAKQHLGLDKDTSEAAVFTAIKTRFDEELPPPRKSEKSPRENLNPSSAAHSPTRSPTSPPFQSAYAHRYPTRSSPPAASPRSASARPCPPSARSCPRSRRKPPASHPGKCRDSPTSPSWIAWPPPCRVIR